MFYNVFAFFYEKGRRCFLQLFDRVMQARQEVVNVPCWVEMLERSGAVVADNQAPRDELVPRESWEVLDKEKKELEEVVKQKEKRLLRLQQVRAPC